MSRWRRIAASMLALAALGAAAPAGAEPAGSPVRLVLEARAGASQGSLVVLRVEGVPEPGLAGFQVTLAWDPERVSIRDPNESLAASGVHAFAPLGGSPLCSLAGDPARCQDPPWLLASTGRFVIGRVEHDAAGGRLTLAYGTAGDEAPATGSGALALLDVRARGDDPPRIDVIDALLADPGSPPRTFPWQARSLGAGGEVAP